MLKEQVIFLFDEYDFRKYQEENIGKEIAMPEFFPTSCFAIETGSQIVLHPIDLKDLQNKFYKYCRKRKFAVERRERYQARKRKHLEQA